MKFKRLIYIFLAIVAVSICPSCDLDTEPTDALSASLIFETAEGAQLALNGIYRALHEPGWSIGWEHENTGLFALSLVKSLNGEDHLMHSQGSGWFYYDYAYWIDADFTSSAGRQYAQWIFNYTIISQTNYVIAHEDRFIAMGSGGKNVIAQAYALRAMAYTCLYEWFCQGNYVENSDAPGVPVYTEPTTMATVGKPRGTVADVFVRIHADFQRAVDLFTEAGIGQAHSSQIDLYAANLLWARSAMITATTPEDWAKVGALANAALSKPGLSRVSTLSELGALNNRNAPSILWAFQVVDAQAGEAGYFFGIMDPESSYGSSGPQCIDRWLYEQIPDSDLRKTGWWGFVTYMPDEPGYFDEYGRYWQIKFRFSDLTTSLGDGIFARAEEALLIAAEAACRQEDWATARQLLLELGARRDPNYAARLATRTNSASYNTNTRGAFTTLMDEILFQRRIELWSEGYGRVFDLRRLNLGYTRDYPNTNHTAMMTMQPNDLRFVLRIPQREIDSNPNINLSDQNPR